MEFSSDNFDQFGVHNDPFGNLLDDEIPQDIFDEIMNDVNFNAMGFDVNSLSSEDSGRSSSSYDDTINRMDTFNGMETLKTFPVVFGDDAKVPTATEMPQTIAPIIKQEPMIIKQESPTIKQEPQSPKHLLCETTNNHGNRKANTKSTVPMTQPMFTVKQTFAPIHQPQLVLSQPKILVKQEPIQMSQQTTRPQILTLQNIGGQFYTTVSTTNQAPMHIMNGATGILTKIPLVPVMPQTAATQNKISVATVALQQTKSTPTTTVAVAKPTKASKKSGHNIIERRYRTSINDKILELKNLISAGAANAKMNKSGILKKSIDKIRSLESENIELKGENQRLRQMLGMKNLSDAIPPLSPPTSTGSESPNSLNASDLESDQKIIFIQRGVSPHSKFALCVFMFAVVAVNSFGLIWNESPHANYFGEDYNGETSRRSLLSSVEPYKVLFSWKSFAVSIVNCLVVMAVIVKLLVYGEPIVDRQKSASSKAEKLKQSTEMSFKAGDLSAASIGYLRQLQWYGICLPSSSASITWFECITYTTWQVLRMIIYRLPFGLWLSHKVGGLFCSNDVRAQALIAYKDIGWILHRLNQIDLMKQKTEEATTDGKKRSQIYGLMVTVYAVNMCETAEPIMFTKEFTELYLAAALRMKALNRARLANYYLRKAKFYHLLGTTQSQRFEWIFSEHGYKFFTKKETVFEDDGERDNQISLTRNSENFEPIAQLQREYCKYILTKSLENLLGFRRNSRLAVNTDERNQQQTQQTQVTLKLANHLIDIVVEDDENACNSILWLARMIICATYWILDDLEKCEPIYGKIDEFSSQHLCGTKTKEKTLLKSLYVIFTAKREYVHRTRGKSMTREKFQLILNRCNIASCLLQNHLTYNRTQNVNTTSLIRLIQILTCDWLLELRTDSWELSQSMSDISSENLNDDEGISEPYSPTARQLQLYQLDLNNLYLIFDTKQMGISRVNLYEAIYRMMAGALPLETYRLLERNIMPLRHSKSNLICVGGSKGNADDEYICGERQRAQSMMLACKYLQAQVGIERAGLLTQAATIFKQIGDITKTNECYQLLSAISTNAAD